MHTSLVFVSRTVRSLAVGACTTTLVALAAAPAHAAGNYPQRPITLIVPFGPGGGVDNVARRLVQELEGLLPQTVVVENRAGAGSVVGVSAAARSAPDGYTILIADPALVINSLIAEKPQYDYARDFVPVSLVSRAPYILVSSTSLPAGTVEEIVERSRQGKGLSFASAGVGTAAHMTGELFRLRTGAQLLHVPYRGGNPAMTDLAAGQVDMVFTTIASARPYLDQRRAKPIATTGTERSPEFPELPTLEERLKDFQVYFWTALFAPAGTPPEIIKTLEEAVHNALQRDRLKKALAETGNIPTPLSGEETRAFIEGENSMWKEVIQKTGLKLQ